MNSKNTIFAEADIEITNVLQPTLNDNKNENKKKTKLQLTMK